MLVAMVTDPGWPACATTCASRSCCLAFSTSWATPSFFRIPESISDVSTDVVPTSTGWRRFAHSRMSSTIASNLSFCVRYTRSAASSRIMSLWVGITTTSSP